MDTIIPITAVINVVGFNSAKIFYVIFLMFEVSFLYFLLYYLHWRSVFSNNLEGVVLALI